MKYDPKLEIGEITTNKKIGDIFKCGNTGGIRRSKKTNTIVLVSDQTKKYYKDIWEDDGVLLYTGMGIKGDQTLKGNQNINVYESNENGIALHLFEVLNKAEYTYRGVAHLVRKPYMDEQNGRQVWIFPIAPEKKRICADTNKDRCKINIELDNFLINEELNSASFKIKNFNKYDRKPKKKKAPKTVKGYKVYVRDRDVSFNALAYAQYKCEVSSSHPLFIRKKINIEYTEPHHLVPMEFSDQFSVSLDVEQNIISLCSNCHNEIHYGRDRHILIEKLYKERRELLKEVEIDITLAELKAMYK